MKTFEAFIPCINKYFDILAALNFGVFRRKLFNETLQRIMFYDMGATSTVCSIVGYQVVRYKERSFTETNPQLTVLGLG